MGRDAATERWLDSNGVEWHHEANVPLCNVDREASMRNQARDEALDYTHVIELGVAILDGAELPSMVAYYNKTRKLVIVDGNHRFAALVDEVHKATADFYIVDNSFDWLIVRLTITANVRNGIPLPIVISEGTGFFDYVALLISHVKCGNCTKCCSTNPCGNPIETEGSEAKALIQKYGTKNFGSSGGNVMHIKVPCGFLDNNGKCSIYEDRPLVCVLYPLQFGASDGYGHALLALDSGCPDAIRLTKEVYLYRWYLRKMSIRNDVKIP